MFRRRRATSRQPASSAWWPGAPGADDPSVTERDQPGALGQPVPAPPPPLPANDPFGGWSAFPVGHPDPTDPVLGHHDPLTGWESPTPRYQAGAPEPPTSAAPTAPASAMPSSVSAPAPSAAAVPSWLPLLTHEENEQRFQAAPEDTGSFDADDGGAGLEADGRASRSRRRTRRAAIRAVPEQATAPPAAPPGTVSDAGSGSPAAPEHPTCSADATTWLDPLAPPHPMEAAALAGAFAADYLSWDEQAPERRGQVLAQYLPSDVVGNPALLGWSGRGRQRAEFALPGAVRPDGDGRVVVDVRVRVTPYRAVGQPGPPATAGDLEVGGVPAVAPAPTARGWKSLDSCWVRLTVPVNRDQGRLVVDTWDEQLGDAGTPAPDPVTPLPPPNDPMTGEDLDGPDIPDFRSAAGEPSDEEAAADSGADSGADIEPAGPAVPADAPGGRDRPGAPSPSASASSGRTGRTGRTGERGRTGTSSRTGGGAR